MEGGSSGGGGFGGLPAQRHRKRSPPKEVSRGWDDVAAAKSDVFKGDDYGSGGAPPNGSGNPTTFDFNSYGGGENPGPGQPTVKRAEPISGGPSYGNGGGPSQTSFSQYRAGLNFSGFQRGGQNAGANKMSYDSYGAVEEKKLPFS